MPFKNGFVSLILLVALGLAGCSGATPTLPASTVAAPTNEQTIPPTVAALTVAPTAVPTIAPTATTIVPAQTAASVLPAAIAKTRAATMFKAHQEMTFGQAFGATRDNTTLMRLDGEFNGNDAHITVGGTMVALFGLEPTASIEFIQAHGKAYTHGPVAGIGAPENKWYILPTDSGMSTAPNPFDMFDDIMQLKLDYAGFKYTRTSSDALACNFYRTDKDIAAKVWTNGIFSATGVEPIVEDGYLEISVCKDGYLHDLTINLLGYDSKNSLKKDNAYFRYTFSDFDTKVAITAPTDAIPAVAPKGGLLGLLDTTATPTPRAMPGTPTPTLNPNAVTIILGEWKGTTATDSSISFTVKDNHVTYASLNLSARNGGCSGSTSLSKSISDAAVVNNTFTAKLSTSDGAQITFAGTFGGGQATGTLSATGKLPCDASEIKTTWTAKNTSAIKSTPTVAGTATKSAATASSPASKSSTTSKDSVSVVDGFFGAINNKNVDAALAFVDENVIYTFGSPTNEISKSNMKGALVNFTTSGTTFTLSNHQVTGNLVKFSARLSDGKTYSTSQAILADGKILLLTIK
ncbi:MAG: hypothetical protein HZB51_27635 [Chloroflexi bacterium]|nr:hypothetical protein [Chloroflexota bacterium]